VAEAENAAPPEPEIDDKPVVRGGKTRGRRRVMKKKTVKDAEGYLGMLFPLYSPSITQPLLLEETRLLTRIQ